MTTTESTKDMKPSENVRLALLWAGLAGLGGVAVMPYLAHLMPELHDAPVPLWVLALVQGVQSFVLCLGLGYVGLRAARANDLDAPLSRAWVTGAPRPDHKLPLMLALGFIGGFAVVALDAAFQPLMPPPMKDIPVPPAHLGLLASLYGGVTEEVLTRLFLVSVVAWGMAKALGTKRSLNVVIAVVVAAVVFGALHLPTAFTLWPPGAVVVVRTIVMNAALGIPFGLVFARYGLEHAVAAHFAADLALHVVMPLLGAGA